MNEALMHLGTDIPGTVTTQTQTIVSPSLVVDEEENTNISDYLVLGSTHLGAAACSGLLGFLSAMTESISAGTAGDESQAWYGYLFKDEEFDSINLLKLVGDTCYFAYTQAYGSHFYTTEIKISDKVEELFLDREDLFNKIVDMIKQCFTDVKDIEFNYHVDPEDNTDDYLMCSINCSMSIEEIVKANEVFYDSIADDEVFDDLSIVLEYR